MTRKVVKENGESPYKCFAQEPVNAKIYSTASMRVDMRLQTDPKMKKIFDDLAMEVIYFTSIKLTSVILLFLYYF
jgi:hypothetical protein